MLLYHGTISSGADNIIKNGISLSKGKLKVDFGQGFYTTPSLEFAKSTAVNKANKTNSYMRAEHVKPYVLTYEFNELAANNTCNILSFTETDLDWTQFIINNRNGNDYVSHIGSDFHNIAHRYDIVKGAIADKDIVLLAKLLNDTNKKATIENIKNIIYHYDTQQISFHTYKSLSYLKLTSCDIIKRKETF